MRGEGVGAWDSGVGEDAYDGVFFGGEVLEECYGGVEAGVVGVACAVSHQKWGYCVD